MPLRTIRELDPGPELDHLLARLIRTAWAKAGPDAAMADRQPPEVPTGSSEGASTPQYSTDLSAAFELEEQIGALGLAGRYVSWLTDIASPGHSILMWARGPYEEDVFPLVHASAHERCLAILNLLADPVDSSPGASG